MFWERVLRGLRTLDKRFLGDHRVFRSLRIQKTRSGAQIVFRGLRILKNLVLGLKRYLGATEVLKISFRA